MNKKIILILIILLLVSVSLINASEKENRVICFYKGNDYLTLEESQKYFFIIGLYDMCAYYLHAEYPEMYLDFALKSDEIAPKQLVAIFDKFLEEHPEEWHNAIADLFVGAMIEFLNK